MLGMPYPNPTDPELCERMRYLEMQQQQHQRQDMHQDQVQQVPAAAWSNPTMSLH